MQRLKTDPARFEVVKNALTCAAEEMKIVLAKTAYSPLLKVAGDYSCGIFDVSGNMVAQGPDLPIHLGSMPDAVRAVVKAFPDAAPGDVFIHNDPYQGGSHLPDVNVVAPAFYEGRLLGFGCVRAHWPDIGSATPGSYGAVTEIYGEGLRLPPIRLYRDGKPDPAIEAIIFANVRTPSERLGDLRAQVAANWRAAARLQALAAKYGTDTLLEIMQEVLDYSETMMRAALRALPDGEAEFSDILDGDGVIAPDDTEDATFTVKLRITKRGDTITADFAGSDPQVAGPMNAPLTVTASGVFCALKMIADPKSLIPPNSGCWRPVTVTAPPGSVVNAQLPAPVVYANHEMSHRVADMVMAAMFAFTPRTVMAGSQGTSAVMTFGGTDYRTGERYVSYELVKGGFGARPVKDGINAVASTVSNMMNTPIEIIEMSFPLRVQEYSLVPDSGGAGTWRGGLGVRRVWHVLERQAHAAVCCERTVTPPFGLDGGSPGAPARLELIPPNGNARKLTSKGGFIAPAGSLVVIEAPGSGGYGPPAGRERARLSEDLLDGYVTPMAARRDYGVEFGLTEEIRMTYVAPNSVQARDIASIVHPQTNLVQHLEQGPVVISRGQGIYVWDDFGEQFLDAAAGLWCASLGYASERLARVAYEQMRKLGYAHLYRGTTNEPGVDLAEKLLQIAPVPMSKVLFQCSGSEANDTAIKLVWYYHAAIGKPAKRKIIGRSMGYHGSTSAAISASGKPDMHADFGLPFPDFRHTEYPHWYRLHADGETEEQFASRMADALEAMIVAEGPDTVGGFIAEPVMGAGGGLTPPRTYWEKMQAVLRRHDVLFIADEVICGFGRTGSMWGSQTYDLKPDMITSAKALSAGMQPISALLINERVFQAMLDESRKLGSFAHGFTYAGHPVTTAVAMETLRIYEEMDMLGHVRRVGPYMQQALGRFADHPLVGDVRGVGLMTGMEMMQDTATRTPFDPSRGVGRIADGHARKHGLITRFIGDRIAFSPPLIITEAEIDDMAARLQRTLDDTWADVRAN